MRFTTLLLLTVLSSGCSAHKPVKAEYVIRRDCLENAELTPDTECRYPLDGSTPHCGPLNMQLKPGCKPNLEVKPEKKEKK